MSGATVSDGYTSRCYEMTPSGYDAGVYQQVFKDGDKLWFDPDAQLIADATLIGLLDAAEGAAQEVLCTTRSAGGAGSGFSYSQLCYSDGTATVVVQGWIEYDEDLDDTLYIAAKVIESSATAYVVGDDISAPPTGFTLTTCQAIVTPAIEPVQCYNQEVPVSEPTSKSNNVANKGYVKQRYWTAAQFANEGNTGNVDAGFHSLVTTDTDGLPTVNGEIASETNVTTMVRSETGASGEFYTWEGLLYNPIRYPDTAAGKYVKKAEIVDTYTNTTYADMEQLYVAVRNGTYTLDRDDLAANLVIDAPAAGSQPAYELDPSQRGRYVRFMAVHGDKGNGAQVNWQMRLTYADGSTQTLALVNFLHQADVQVAYQASTELNQLTYDTTTGEWKENGSTVTVDTSLGNLQKVPCGELPITFTPYLSGDTFTISNPVGGSGTGYEYSIDGGRTWGTTNVFNLGSDPAREIIPVVRDGNGSRSAKSGLTSYVPCVNFAWATNFAAGTNGRNSNDVGGGTGFEGIFSDPLGNQLEQSNSGLTWAMTDATNNTSYMYLGNGFTTNESAAVAALNPVLPVAESGQEYTVAVDPYHYYFGYPFGKTSFSIAVVDQVTGNTLGQYTRTFYSNGVESLTNQEISFVGAGNPVNIEVNASVSPLTSISGFAGDTWDLHLDSITSDGYIKRGGAAWTTGILSTTAQPLSSGVNVKFQATAGNANAGMHGLNSSNANDSYSAGDYLIYLTGGSVGIYEKGASRGSFGTYTDTDVFEVNITAGGTVTYLKNGVVFYTSTVNATENMYWYAGYPYATNQGIKGFTFTGSQTIVSDDWIGETDQWIEDNGDLRKLYTAGWNTWMQSSTMRAKADGVIFEISPLHSSGSGFNEGMIGLSGDQASTSYTSIDYAFYFNGTQVYVYEKGTSRGIKAASYNDGQTFSIEIDAAGTVTYKRGNAVLYTSTVTADKSHYFVDATPYDQNGGFKNYSFNGTEEFNLPDATGSYIRLNTLRLFEGKYSDATHYAYKTSSYYFIRNIRGTEILTTDAHMPSADEDVMIIPKLNLGKYGTPLAGDYVEFQYSLDGGPWVTMHREDDNYDVAGQVYMTPFTYAQGVEVPAGETIQYRLVVHMDDNNTNRGYYVYDISDSAKCS